MDDLRRPVARLATHPDDGPWAPVALMLSADPDTRPLQCAITSAYPDPDDDDVKYGIISRDVPVEVDVTLWDFTWEGPPSVSSEDRWSLEVWIPVADAGFTGAVAGAENWAVLWVPAIRLKLPNMIGPDPTTGAPPEIAFTTEGVARARAEAPPLPAVPAIHRGNPVTYLFTQHTTTERPPAERNRTGA